MMKCTVCNKEIRLQCNDDEPYKISGEPVCRDCYFEGLGKVIEEHPIGFHLLNKTVEPQHCDHECVCWWHYEHKRSGSAAPCISKRCHHRSNPATQPARTWENCVHHFTCPDGEECWYLSEDCYANQHHAAISKSEREKAINILKKVKNTIKHLGFLVIDHDLPVLYICETEAAIDLGLQDLSLG
jgi:hypothetical protein